MRLIVILMLASFTASAQVFSTDGNAIYTDIQGSGDTTLLFIAGWNLDHTSWASQVEEFSERYKTVTLDLPGYGASGKSREHWTMQAYGQDIRTVIDQLGLKNVILIAHSMGGNIALETLNSDSREIIGLIGVDNFKQVGAVSTPEDKEQIALFIDMLREDYPANVRASSESFMFAPDSPAGPKEQVLSEYAAADPEVAIAVLEGVFAAEDREAELLQTVNVPFAVISAEFIPFDQSGVDRFYHGPSFHLYTLTASGHFPMVENPGVFNSLLATALGEMFSE